MLLPSAILSIFNAASTGTNVTWGNGTLATWGNGTQIQWSGIASYPGLTQWKSALANAAIGVGRPRVLYCGDSITFGAGSNNSITTGDMIVNNYVTKLTALLNSGGYAAQSNTIIADGGLTAVCHSVNDAREVYGGVFGHDSTFKTVGGFSLTRAGTPGAGNTYTFSGIDTFRLWYPLIGTGTATPGNLTYQVDGGSVTTISLSSGGSANGTPTFIDIPCGSLGTHVLTVNTSSTNTCCIMGVEGINSASNQISLINAGWTGSYTNDWIVTTRPWSPGSFIGSYNQDLTVIALGDNDWFFSLPISTFVSNLLALTATASAHGGSVAWQTPVPCDPSRGTTQAVQVQYVNAMKVAAKSNGIPIIDVFGYFGDYTNASGRGWMFDTVHPNAAGCAIIAQLNYNVLTAP